MAVKITYFVHGTSIDNENGSSSGWQDCPLSKLGTKQARDLRERIDGKKFDAVFCSDLKRAKQTAAIAFEGEKIIPEKRLRECNYGDYNGSPESLVEPMCKKHVTQIFPGGESYEDVKSRLQEFLIELKRSYDEKHVAIVAHKAPQLALDVLLKGKTWEQAFAEDWRKTKSWQPGWEYELK
ncbi:MAG: histidine phosphatase family protein [Patescibacteria group bacterium]|nr:histidine phosphatase family protein [Patescibacteria group bacterium]